MKNYFKNINFRIKPPPNNQKPYILPTALGFSYGALILLIIIISLNNKNNLIFLFSFFLFSIGVTITLTTHKNLEKIKIFFREHNLIFQNEKTKLQFQIENYAKYDVYYIKMYFTANKNSTNLIQQLPAQSSKVLSIENTFEHYGTYQLPEITIESTFPVHFLRVWKYISIDQILFIFPQKINYLNLNIVDFLNSFEIKRQLLRTHPLHSSEDSEFLYAEKNEFPTNIRNINWKIYAKTDELYSNIYSQSSQVQPSILIDWSVTDALENFDQKISQLSYIIFQLIDRQKKITVQFPEKTFNINRSDYAEIKKIFLYAIEKLK